MNENRSETIRGIPVVIPSYEPDEQLVELCEALVTAGITDICIVDDGSGEEYRSIFDRIETTYANENVRILRHTVNMGKGRALKTAFQDLLEHRPELIGCVTADSDGQHTPKDIYRCMLELAGHPDRLIMGCRRFDGEDVPLKSRYGNELTRRVCQYLCGRAIGSSLRPGCLLNAGTGWIYWRYRLRRFMIPRRITGRILTRSKIPYVFTGFSG